MFSRRYRYRWRKKKPVLYLYPEDAIDVKIKLNFKNSKFSCVYPKFNESENTWKVRASPNGEITISDKKYPYLFWEAISYFKPDLSKGFIVKAEDAEKFLEEKLKMSGLNEKEWKRIMRLYYLLVTSIT